MEKDVGDKRDQEGGRTFGEVTQAIRHFVAERQWEPFHTPRNLILALVGEVGELAELFQWVPDAEVAAKMKEPDFAEKVRDELSDVGTYLLRIADVLGVDLDSAMEQKMAKNAAKYPVEKARGRATKYLNL